MRRFAAALAGLALALLITGLVLSVYSASDASEHTEEAPTPPTVVMPERVPSHAPAIDGPGPGESATVKLTSTDREREFVLSVPENYSAGERWPVIFAFHGWGESANHTHSYTNFDRTHALVAYPQGIDDAWEGAPYAKTAAGEDQQFVTDMLDTLRATYQVDDSRIFAAGFSNGGGFAALLGCQMNEVFAGVASVSAAYYDTIFRDCADTPIALLDIHGTDDPVIDYYGGQRHDADYAPVEQVLELAANRNTCSSEIRTSRINSWALRQDWTGCNYPLSHIRIGGGGHVWPGAKEDTFGYVPKDYASKQILRFFGVSAG